VQCRSKSNNGALSRQGMQPKAGGLRIAAMPFGSRRTMVQLIVLDKRGRFAVYTSTSESQIECLPHRRLAAGHAKSTAHAGQPRLPRLIVTVTSG
jgi:hypothetical protein